MDEGTGEMENGQKAKTHEEWDVYRLAFDLAWQVFEVSKRFPLEERYSLTDPILRSSRAVCARLAEAWQRRGEKSVFAAKLNDGEADAAQTQVWLEFAVRCGYVEGERARDLSQSYERILNRLVSEIARLDCGKF